MVEGAIGVGKTSLARKLAATLGAQVVLEQADENPFLERFYRNPRVGALPAQLYFLFQRAQQQAPLKQQDLFGSVRVADYLLAKDDLFARMTLEDEEYGFTARCMTGSPSMRRGRTWWSTCRRRWTCCWIALRAAASRTRA